MEKKIKRLLSTFFSLGIGVSTLSASTVQTPTNNKLENSINRSIIELKKKSEEEKSGISNLLSENSFAKCLVRYTEKANKETHEALITGKIKLVPMNSSHRDSWNNLFDSTSAEQKDYLKWYTTAENLDSNSLVTEEFDMTLMYSKFEKKKFMNTYYYHLANVIPFMIEFTEFENPVKIKDISSAKEKSSKIAGTISICPYKNEYDKDDNYQFLFDYVVDKSAQGKGIGTAAIKCAQDFASQLNLQGIYQNKGFFMKIANNNIGSIRVAEKTGFHDSGEIPIETSNFLPAHKWEKEDNSNKVLNLLNVYEGNTNLKNFFKSFILPFSENDEYPVDKCIGYNEWVANKDKYKKSNPNEYEKIEKNLDDLNKKSGPYIHEYLEYIELPIAWKKTDGYFTNAINSDISEGHIQSIEEVLSYRRQYLASLLFNFKPNT